MFNVQEPFFLGLLLILPLYLILYYAKCFKKLHLPLTLGLWNGTSVKKNSKVYALHHLTQWLAALGFTALVIVLTQPIYITTEPLYTGQGQALMFVLDISPSMAAQDMNNHTRLETAKHMILSFIQQYEGDSCGLTALASTAAVLLPPTVDKRTFADRLEQLQPGELGEGTAIGMGLAVAVLHLSDYSATPSHIILLTDGDNNTGKIHPRTAAEIIKHKNIGFSVIGIGKSGYAPVRYFDSIQQKEISGTLHTTFDETELKKIALTGNGHYFSAQSPAILAEAFQTIAHKLPATPVTFTKQHIQQLDTIFLSVALGCAALAWCIRRLMLKEVLT